MWYYNGTFFEVEIGGDVEECMLVGTVEGLEPQNFYYVTADSPMGKSVIHKKIGDNFAYNVSHTGREITELNGRITAIKENPFLKEKQKTL